MKCPFCGSDCDDHTWNKDLRPKGQASLGPIRKQILKLLMERRQVPLEEILLLFNIHESTARVHIHALRRYALAMRAPWRIVTIRAGRHSSYEFEDLTPPSTS